MVSPPLPFHLLMLPAPPPLPQQVSQLQDNVDAGDPLNEGRFGEHGHTGRHGGVHGGKTKGAGDFVINGLIPKHGCGFPVTN
ncbi:hypothetical protein [Xylella fastidiosa]|uniref:hypothetical protein n=1 Tax=Xylella fastidiosa TaxID=2371 RepID=UPI0007336668|nr:hypothetical protein [Xylella fastidiosa]